MDINEMLNQLTQFAMQQQQMQMQKFYMVQNIKKIVDTRDATETIANIDKEFEMLNTFDVKKEGTVDNKFDMNVLSQNLSKRSEVYNTYIEKLKTQQKQFADEGNVTGATLIENKLVAVQTAKDEFEKTRNSLATIINSADPNKQVYWREDNKIVKKTMYDVIGNELNKTNIDYNRIKYYIDKSNEAVDYHISQDKNTNNYVYISERIPVINMSGYTVSERVWEISNVNGLAPKYNVINMDPTTGKVKGVDPITKYDLLRDVPKYVFSGGALSTGGKGSGKDEIKETLDNIIKKKIDSIPIIEKEGYKEVTYNNDNFVNDIQYTPSFSNPSSFLTYNYFLVGLYNGQKNKIDKNGVIRSVIGTNNPGEFVVLTHKVELKTNKDGKFQKETSSALPYEDEYNIKYVIEGSKLGLKNDVVIFAKTDVLDQLSVAAIPENKSENEGTNIFSDGKLYMRGSDGITQIDNNGNSIYKKYVPALTKMAQVLLGNVDGKYVSFLKNLKADPEYHYHKFVIDKFEMSADDIHKIDEAIDVDLSNIISQLSGNNKIINSDLFDYIVDEQEGKKYIGVKQGDKNYAYKIDITDVKNPTELKNVLEKNKPRIFSGLAKMTSLAFSGASNRIPYMILEAPAKDDKNQPVKLGNINKDDKYKGYFSVINTHYQAFNTNLFNALQTKLFRETGVIKEVYDLQTVFRSNGQ